MITNLSAGGARFPGGDADAASVQRAAARRPDNGPVDAAQPSGGDDAGLAREAQRQALLLRTLWRQAPDTALTAWLRDAPERTLRALSAYRSNGAAMAARALAAAFPTVVQMVGEEPFQSLAAAFWHACPPRRGDLAELGAALPDFIAADTQLADVPWLADCARLDWAVHRAESSADGADTPSGLERLATDDPRTLGMRLQPGTALVESAWPIVTLWQAHRSDADDRFAAARAALAEGRAETAWVWRAGWRAQVAVLAPAGATFTRALLNAQTLSDALAAVGTDFSFEPWLLDALRHGRIGAIHPHGADPFTGDAS